MNDRITSDLAIYNGRPFVRGTQITVTAILEFMGAGRSIEDILKENPSLTREDIMACLKYAASR